MCQDCADELAWRSRHALDTPELVTDPKTARLVVLEAEERDLSVRRRMLHRQIDRLRRDLGVL